MWTTIAYKNAFDGNITIRIYDDSTEKSFNSYEEAMIYSIYLSGKGNSTDVYEVKVYIDGELNIEELKKQDALNKLTNEEKQLLGLD